MNKKSEFHIQNVSKLFIQYNSHFQLMAIGQIGVPGPCAAYKDLWIKLPATISIMY